MKHTIGHDGTDPIIIDAERLLSTRMLIQANSGGGKSWMLRLLMEMLGTDTPLILLDWEGEFASLREALDVLLVGNDGEIPTAIATAGPLATQILEMGVSAVIDLYNLNPHDKREYARRFLESLMAAPKRLYRPYFLGVDEAHGLAPEAGDAVSRDAVSSLMCQGRKRQFCGILATQRLSKLHKDAAAECNNVLIGRTTLDVDVKRAADILGMRLADAMRELRALKEGEFYGFGPAFNFDGVRKFKSGTVKTTHKVKAGTTFKPPAPSAKMQGAIGQLRDLAERSKTEVLDLDTARATIADLSRLLREAERAKPAPVVDQGAIERARVEACQEVRAAVAPHLAHAAKTIESFSELVGIVVRSIDTAQTLLALGPSEEDEGTQTVSGLAQARLVREIVAQTEVPLNGSPGWTSRKHESTVSARPDRELSPRPERAAITGKRLFGSDSIGNEILSAVRWWMRRYPKVSRAMVAIAVGAHPRSKGFTNALGALRSAGRIEYAAEEIQLRGEVSLVQAPSLDAAQAFFIDALDARQGRILQLLMDAGGDGLTREQLAETMACHPRSKGFTNDLGALHGRGLVEYERGREAAAEWLLG